MKSVDEGGVGREEDTSGKGGMTMDSRGGGAFFEVL